MSSTTNEASELLVRRLASHRPLGPSERELLEILSWRIEEIPQRQTFIHEGERPTQSCLVVSGVLARTQYTADGRRQILSVHIAGDMPDLQSLHIGRMDHDLETVSPATVAFVAHADLHRLCNASSHLNAAFWRESLIDAALHRAAIFRNGQLEAEARLAHFLCEMHLRHMAVGRVCETGFDLPLSQELIGEVLGLTIVSINKAAQSLRARNLIDMQRGHVAVLDFERLVQLCQFDGTFLHLRFDDPALGMALAG